MIERPGRVVRVEPGQVWVLAEPRQGCAGCAESGACGSAALGRWWARRQRLLRLPSEGQDLAVGDRVLLAIPEGAVLSGSVLVYLIPILAMLVCAIGAGALFEGASREPMSAVAGAVGLALGLGWARRRGAGRSAGRLQPRLLVAPPPAVAAKGEGMLLP